MNDEENRDYQYQYLLAEKTRMETENQRLTKDPSTCEERVREAFKQGWDDALECMEAEKGINGYPIEAQFENCWYAYECQIAEQTQAQTKEEEG